MRRVSMATRDELVAAVSRRYGGADRAERGRILDEFTQLTGFHRKHASRVLRKGHSEGSGLRRRRRIYDEATREALLILWEASDRVCGKRLRPLLPVLVEAMERHGHLQLAAVVRSGVLAMSAATIDRVLRERRGPRKGRGRRRSVASAIQRSVAVRRFDGWDDPPPGYVEADLVAHSGPSLKGHFIQTLTVTDISSGWTECAPVLVREQTLLAEVLAGVGKSLPFALLGFDTDNDAVFMNATVRDYCQSHGIEFTRCRPYRKNDQAWVEQKNGAVVRRAVGYRRYEGLAAAATLARLYAAMRLFVNYFQPSFKLAGKARDGAKVRKRYHAPATPYQRLLAEPRMTEEAKRRLEAVFATLDPVKLLSEIRKAQTHLVEIADRMVTETGAPDEPTLEEFLASLRTTWRQDEVRPTAPKKEMGKRGRRRPDPLAAVTAQLREWCEAEPWRTSRELLDRLQGEQPGVYPDRLLRTLQRRVKDWRRELARKMILPAATGEATGVIAAATEAK